MSNKNGGIAKNRGVTLAELAVSLGILGLLTSIVFGSISVSRAKARDNARISDMKTIELALALYYDVNRRYPLSSGTDINILDSTLVSDKYLASLPADPSAGQVYKYKLRGNKYCLGVKLEGDPPDDSPEAQSFCNDPEYYWSSR